MATCTAHSAQQVAEMERFVGDDSLFVSGSVAYEYLLEPPTKDISTSKAELGDAFLMVVSKSSVKLAELLVVPVHFCNNEGIVLGNILMREPEKRQLSSEEGHWKGSGAEDYITSSNNDRLSLSRFAFQLATGKLLQVTRRGLDYAAVVDYSLAYGGFLAIRVGCIPPDCQTLGFVATPACPFCSARKVACICPFSLRRRLAGPHLNFTRWSQFLELGRLRGLPTELYTIFHLQGYGGEDVFTQELEVTWAFNFDRDGNTRDAVSCYLYFLDAKTRSVDRPPVPETNEPQALPLTLPDDDLPLNSLCDISELDAHFWDSENFVGNLREGLVDVPKELPNAHCGRYVCPHCGLGFSKSNNRNRHVAATHEGERGYSCSICSSKFTQPGNMRRHMRSVHFGQKSVHCDICGVGISSRINLMKHMKARHLPDEQRKRPSGSRPD